MRNLSNASWIWKIHKKNCQYIFGFINLSFKRDHSFLKYDSIVQYSVLNKKNLGVFAFKTTSSLVQIFLATIKLNNQGQKYKMK